MVSIMFQIRTGVVIGAAIGAISTVIITSHRAPPLGIELSCTIDDATMVSARVVTAEFS
jgi:hypothetical protein